MDPAAGSGIGRSTISSGPFGRETCATRMVAMLPPGLSASVGARVAHATMMILLLRPVDEGCHGHTVRRCVESRMPRRAGAASASYSPECIDMHRLILTWFTL